MLDRFRNDRWRQCAVRKRSKLCPHSSAIALKVDRKISRSAMFKSKHADWLFQAVVGGFWTTAVSHSYFPLPLLGHSFSGYSKSQSREDCPVPPCMCVCYFYKSLFYEFTCECTVSVCCLLFVYAPESTHTHTHALKFLSNHASSISGSSNCHTHV